MKPSQEKEPEGLHFVIFVCVSLEVGLIGGKDQSCLICGELCYNSCPSNIVFTVDGSEAGGGGKVGESDDEGIGLGRYFRAVCSGG